MSNNFQSIMNDENIGKCYLVVTKTTPPRKTFAQYNGSNKFLYISPLNNAIYDQNIVFPHDFADNKHADDVCFYHIPLPPEMLRLIQDHGTQY